MNAREFYETVKQMRHLQREYFRHRGTTLLQECKKMEAIVDGEISRVETVLSQQQQQQLDLGL